MRRTSKWIAGLAGLLVLAALAPLQAQPPTSRFVRLPVAPASRPPLYVTPPRATSIGAGTTVFLPDGGIITVGGYARESEGRAEYGAPVAGKVPYLGRGFRNAAYGRDTASNRISASVRIIDLREEEYRQTGFRSP